MADLIERQAAIELCDWYQHEFCECDYAFGELANELHKLPSAQPEIIRCKDCKHWDIFDTHSTLMPNHKRCRGSMGKIYTAPDFYCAFGERKDK